ncbi:pantoate--beta-alanine ligase [Candidatus Magnetominusculus xianensis]|uniref:Pantothenate synthetase n=1 Tax=Candidatus Magnetominusculus xianensis TaxID=1748249 RepID=A0ABR5SFR1_9BACT|nr:pantoate--beta-alanine ligase [Candidatus Magnetominusculus xianensis]KWT86759.1 pantoate--beta-alanine ligase [Candidatus Magnetominusculus xianensis]MBF0402522.1 pantoate--beta-alanine ligase [Nitrospirota bacterium]
MQLIRTISEMQQFSKGCKLSGKTIGFVPTMGALHDGHLSIVRDSVKANDVTVVSIFVNPTQFSAGEDFNRYPRDYDGDIEKLSGLSVDAVFLPGVDSVYPDGYKTYVEVRGLSEKLCGQFRPGHFAGVATVVLKLFNAVMPTRAYFGLKDYQQCVVIKKMTADLNLDLEIVLCPTIREHDGLAMSSRNAYLSTEERLEAPLIYKALTEAAKSVNDNSLKTNAIAQILKESLSEMKTLTEIQYASAYDPNTLDEIKTGGITEGQRVLIAVALKIGSTRLIDNIEVD